MTRLGRIPLIFALTGFAAVVGPSDPTSAKPRGSCTDPTPRQCIAKGYLESYCGKKKAALCKDTITKKLEAQHKASRAPKRKMFKPGGTAIPKDLRMGKYRRYKGPKGRNKLGKKGKNAFARQKLTRPTGPKVKSPPLDAHRNPKWEENGNLVANCQEYAYERLYDWSRFVDAVAACRGDDGCIADVTLQKKAPGLDQVMESRDKTEKLPNVTKKKAVLPKNPYFAFGDKFAYAEGPQGVEPDPKWDSLAAALRTGERFYFIGQSGGRKKKKKGPAAAKAPKAQVAKHFKDEFAYHRALRKATKTVSIEERREFARRRRLMEELTEMWWMAHYTETSGTTPPMVKAPDLKHQVELAFDTQTMDPLARLLETQKRVKTARTAAKKLAKKGRAGRPGAGWISRPVQRKSSFRSLPEIDADLRTVLAAPRPGKKKAKKKRKKQQIGMGSPKLTKPGASAIDIPCTEDSFDPFFWKKGPPVFGKDDKPPMETLGWGPISCRIGMLLRHEWERELAGETTCLDLLDPSCDWEPEMLVDRFVDAEPFLQRYSKYETECMDWAQSDLAKKAMLPHEVTAKIASNKDAVGEAKAALKDYNTGKTNSAGSTVYAYDWNDSESWGDKSLFGSQYSSSLGWSIEATKFKTGAACQFKADAHANLTIDGYLAGSKKSIIAADGRVSSKATGANLNATVLLLGENLFPPQSGTITKAWAPKPKGKTVALPKLKPTVHIQAGPVPITASVWAELFFGAGMSANARFGGCGATDVAAELATGPLAAIGAKAQAGVGISGIASAGIRGYLNLITLGLPFEIGLELKNGAVQFGGGLDLTLASLSGYLALYIEYLIGEDEFEIVSWEGIGPEEIELFKLKSVSMLLMGFDK